MDKEKRLGEINKELKVFINQAEFISQKLRNKMVKELGDVFSIKLPVENFKNLDVSLTEYGSIIMRDEEYKSGVSLSFEEVEERYKEFSIKIKEVLEKKEINFYTMNDNSNYFNVFILLLYVLVFLFLLELGIKSFFAGEYLNIIYFVFVASSFFVPNFRNRLEKAINFIKKKFKK